MAAISSRNRGERRDNGSIFSCRRSRLLCGAAATRGVSRGMTGPFSAGELTTLARLANSGAWLPCSVAAVCAAIVTVAFSSGVSTAFGGALGAGVIGAFTNASGGGVTASLTQNTTPSGWTIGGGAEIALAQHWSAKLEYLYVDLGTVTNTVAITGAPTLVDHARVQTNVVRAGVNYRF